jgi:NADH-quinone oxidoreductase subunit L
MALFVFSMLMLVQSGNLLLLLVGWGLVGLSSYLLIGFWHERPTAVAAAKKAFVMNAFGDATFALALFLLIQHTGTLDFGPVFASAPAVLGHDTTVSNLVALGLLGGAVAKSAQIPLHTWLPDAMEGPTPVSALIHAATMVTAGVYLIVRTHALFELAPYVQDTAAALGAATLVFAGLVALVQTDIKRVIAYSTMSQIGYMFLGVGLGAYADGMFHLMAHAFFKALLFMGAGIVIHALGGEQDIRRMGGLRKLMPLTAIAMWIGGLALVGIPGFAGFFSKDAILASALDHGTFGAVLWVFGQVGAFLTGVYTFRLIFLVFGGEPSGFVDEHFHRLGRDLVGFALAAPVAVLAVLSVVGGWIQFADVWTGISNWLDPVAGPLVQANGTQETVSSIVAVGLGVAGIATAWWFYSARRAAPPKPVPALEHKLWWDEAYDYAFYRPAVLLAVGLYRWIERPLVEGSITGIATGFRDLGLGARRLQTGFVRSYALAVAVGLTVLAVVFISVR